MKKEKRKEHLVHYANGPSLEEINSTIDVPKDAGFIKTLFAFSGPGALIAVGYMDPGNWITSIEGGSAFKYNLLSIVLLSSLIAMMLQYMAAKLGIVTRMDLAQNMRARTGRKTGIALWITTELAIMATDIAEIIGSAVALQLIFNIPLLMGVLITIFDVMLLMLLMKLGFRKIEAFVAALILVIFVVFTYQVVLSQPNLPELFKGYLPTPSIATNPSQLTLALGIIGATVMPHNLFLHSALSQTRKIDHDNPKEIKKAIRFVGWDSNIQLTLAFVINSLLLVLGASLFYGHSDNLGRFVDLFHALQNEQIVGSIASPVLSMLFAVALLASGQNSTITGTMTGEVVMEGFLHLKLPLWLRRVITRGLAVLPVIICVIIYGGKESAVEGLLLYSQVFLSIALPISMIPLTLFTSDKKVMGEFTNKKWMTILAWAITIVLTLLNFRLIVETINSIF
ncbi:MAG: Nramp family divalent metal transporter [Streptococcaceae bacterium]|jgi:manganese transport protein|nr:Nramp family divalent metal transporter [Streptococcaceae bacterium]